MGVGGLAVRPDLHEKTRSARKAGELAVVGAKMSLGAGKTSRSFRPDYAAGLRWRGEGRAETETFFRGGSVGRHAGYRTPTTPGSSLGELPLRRRRRRHACQRVSLNFPPVSRTPNRRRETTSAPLCVQSRPSETHPSDVDRRQNHRKVCPGRRQILTAAPVAKKTQKRAFRGCVCRMVPSSSEEGIRGIGTDNRSRMTDYRELAKISQENGQEGPESASQWSEKTRKTLVLGVTFPECPSPGW